MNENGSFAALKLFLVFGPLMGLLLLDRYHLMRDRKREEEAKAQAKATTADQPPRSSKGRA